MNADKKTEPMSRREISLTWGVVQDQPDVFPLLYQLRQFRDFPAMLEYFTRRGITGKFFLEYWVNCGGTAGQVALRTMADIRRHMKRPLMVRDLKHPHA